MTWDGLSDEVSELFAGFTMDAVDDCQLDLFTWCLREQVRRRESHRERQRIVQRIRPVVVRQAINASRKDYWRTYREQKRRAAGVKPMRRVTAEERREYRRVWMANKRAALRAA